MDSPVQLEDNFPIHVYLSYRCKNPRDVHARDKLKTLCAQQNITLRYDESETEEGDSLIKFMDDLTSARCVFLFLSPKYFQSAYTLYELICINEQADLEKSFVLPLRVCDDMVDKCRTAVKDFWFSDQAKADRDKLADMLNQDNYNVLWQRIDSAWEAIVKPYLDELHSSLETGDADEVLSELLGKSKTAIKEAIKQSTHKLHEASIRKIKVILARNHINADEKFREELELSTNNDAGNIAAKLVSATEVGDAIAILTRVLREKKLLLNTESDEWKASFFDAEELCGWLLINSVDPVWWFLNEIKLKKTAKTSIIGTISLNDPNYIEVVISRGLLQNARYSLDKNNQPKPASQKDDFILFDAASPKAIKDQLLINIYKDLHGVEPSSDIDILSKIVTSAKTNYKTEKGKLIYYLVSQEYLNTFKNTDWYQDVEKQLAGYLQFICCNQPVKPNEQPASIEDPTQLLDQVAKLIFLKN